MAQAFRVRLGGSQEYPNLKCQPGRRHRSSGSGARGLGLIGFRVCGLGFRDSCIGTSGLFISGKDRSLE